MDLGGAFAFRLDDHEIAFRQDAVHFVADLGIGFGPGHEVLHAVLAPQAVLEVAFGIDEVTGAVDLPLGKHRVDESGHHGAIGLGLLQVGDCRRAVHRAAAGLVGLTQHIQDVPVFDNASVPETEQIEGGQQLAFRSRRAHVDGMEHHHVAVGNGPVNVGAEGGPLLQNEAQETFQLDKAIADVRSVLNVGFREVTLDGCQVPVDEDVSHGLDGDFLVGLRSGIGRQGSRGAGQ